MKTAQHPTKGLKKEIELIKNHSFAVKGIVPQLRHGDIGDATAQSPFCSRRGFKGQVLHPQDKEIPDAVFPVADAAQIFIHPDHVKKTRLPFLAEFKVFYGPLDPFFDQKLKVHVLIYSSGIRLVLSIIAARISCAAFSMSR